jgi:farnesol dehydrogenase
MLTSAPAGRPERAPSRAGAAETNRNGGVVEIFLTGGTGYLGGRVAERLLAAGHTLRLLYRSMASPPLERPGVLPVKGDLTRPESLRDAIAGVDAVVHTAAMVKSYVPDPRAMEAVNVDAVGALIDISASLGVGRIVYTSSFMALGPSDARERGEGDPAERSHFHNDYERTKFLGDRIARRAQARGAPVIVLYPTVIFGPGALTAGNHVAKIIRDHLRGRLPGRLGRGDALWNYAYIDDVVEAHLLALERGVPGGRYVVGGENVSIDGFLDALAEVSGVPAPTRRIPRRLARMLASLLVLKCRLLGGEPDLTPEVVEIYERSWAYSSDAAIGELGYRPTPFREALERTVAWARRSLEGPAA